MFTLSDFYQLPQLKPLLAEIIADRHPGVTLLVGVEGYSLTRSGEQAPFLPSGRQTFFDTLCQQILTSHPDLSAVLVVAGKASQRVPREFRHRLKVFSGELEGAVPRQIAEAMRLKPDLLIVDRLDREVAESVFQTASRGSRVLAQCDTALWGFEVIRSLQNWGLSPDHLNELRWILTLRRLPALCRSCRRPALPDPMLISRLRLRFPGLLESFGENEPIFYQAIGCEACRGRGRSGDILAFDVYSAHLPGKSGVSQTSLLPLEAYLLQLAVQGYLALEDLVFFEADQRSALYQLYASGRKILTETEASLRRKLAELEAANLVLLKRTEVLISLQETVQLLTSTASLEELAERVCQRARDMCGAERAILYFLQPSETGQPQARILAVTGWDKRLAGRVVPASLVLDPKLGRQPSACNTMPEAGLPSEFLQEAEHLRSGIQVPLEAQERRIGLMILQTTREKKFTPGETSLLQTFASQAALAIQRAGLIEELRQKVAQLEAAQRDLVEKEHLEHELELARQVQQSVLPKVFPSIPGFTFAALNSPARQVGGDFYDVLSLDEGHFGIVIADVADKGMPAALYMALTRSLLLAEARRSLSPTDVLTRVNQLLLELGSSSQFVSVFFGIIETHSRRMRYARAGHDRPLLIRSSEVLPLPGNGAVLGILPEQDLNLTQETLTFQPGDRLVLYTDGLIDALNSQGEFFGLERLQDLLKGLSSAGPQEISTALFAEIDRYRQAGEPFDDTTLLVIGVD